MIISCSTFTSAQQIVYVPEDYPTIQSAILSSNNYDTILISEGTYLENISLRDKTLTIGSKYLLTGDTSYISNTIIEGQSGSAVIRIDGNVGEETTISGLTIKNGDDGIVTYVKFNLIRNHILNCGDAVDYENNSGGLCIGNTIELNYDDAIDLDSTINIVIENNILRNNSDDGIEIRLHRYSGPTAKSIIKSNQIYGNGEDGIQLIGDDELTDRIIYIDNNIISDNQMAGIGSMAFMNTVENYEGSNIEERIFLTNNTITNNNHGITGSNNMILINNIISNNVVAGIKNIDGNSVVVNTNFWENGNDILNCNTDSSTTIFKDPNIDSSYNLSYKSPCIDEGSSYYVIENDTVFKASKEIFGNEIDLGAKEYDGSFLLKGPYLNLQDKNSHIVVSWQLINSDSCNLEWGRNKSNLSNRVTTIENIADTYEHLHSYVLHSLVPGAKYYFAIEENGTKHHGSFLSPPPNEEEATSFYSFGDSRSAVNILDSISKGILKEIQKDTASQTFILHTGDWTTSGTEDEWQDEFFNRNYPNNLDLQSMMPFTSVRGSHENFFDPEASIFKKYFPLTNLTSESRFYYSFDYGPIHISVIDQFVPYDAASIQNAWLENDLNISEKKWKIIALHEPGYSDGGHANNIDVQQIIQPLCDEYKVQLIVAGHNHYYSHNKVNNTHHLTLGGGGAPLTDPQGTGEGLVFSKKAFHFAKIQIEENELKVRIINPDGTDIDTFAIYTIPSSVENIEDRVAIYPNPVTDIFNMDGLNLLSTDECIVEIRSLSGRILMREEVYESRIRMNISQLPPGLYFLVLNTNQINKTYRIVKI